MIVYYVLFTIFCKGPSVPILPGQSRILTACPEVSRDAELSRILNPGPILSCFECNVTTHVDKVYTYIGLIHCYIHRIRCHQMRSLEFKMHHIHVGWSSARTLQGELTSYELTTLPRSPSRLGRGMPLSIHLHPRRLRCLDLGDSNSVPISHRRFLVTLIFCLHF